jgi:hypothetical protein
MAHRFLCACCTLVLLAGSALALEAVGTIKKVDADKGVVIVFAGGQDRTLKADKDLKILDEKGKDLADGLKSKELKEGSTVTITVERENNELVLKQLRLGGKEGAKTPPGGNDPRRKSGEKLGFKPLNEMTAQDKYNGEDGGLYGGGQNEPPAAHQAAAKKETAQIVPRDKDGKPAKDGKIVLISISMSNWTQEFSMFKQIADKDPDKSPLVTIVDCAQGGQTMARWADPKANPWSVAEQRLTQAGVTPAQVQVAWIKIANAGPQGELAEHGKRLQKDTVAVLQNARNRFPNLRIVYLESRIFAGYGTGALNPEPYAYEGAFVVRWLIQDQIKGEQELNYDASRGTVKAPLILWGAYLWGDGLTPRKADELVWKREDLGGDGIHPSDAGRRKVADLLLKFCKTDVNVKSWFVKP